MGSLADLLTDQLTTESVSGTIGDLIAEVVKKLDLTSIFQTIIDAASSKEDA